jgi:hypothetical protein
MAFVTQILSSLFNLVILAVVVIGLYYAAKFGYAYYLSTVPHEGTAAYDGGGSCTQIPDVGEYSWYPLSDKYPLTTKTDPRVLELFKTQSACNTWLNDSSIQKVIVTNSPDVGPGRQH